MGVWILHYQFCDDEFFFHLFSLIYWCEFSFNLIIDDEMNSCIYQISNVKNLSSISLGSVCRWSTLFWSWGITCEKFELNVDMISMPAVNIILELMCYVWKLELSVHSITMSVINTILELRHYIHVKFRAQCRWDHYAGDRHYFGAEAMWFSVDHIISLTLTHLREIT